MHPAQPLRSLRRALLVCMVVWHCAPTGAAVSEPMPVAVYAEAFAPLQYLSDQNEPTGYVVAFAQELLAQVQHRVALQVRPLEFVPLKRALVIAEREANVLLLSVARTPEREEKYIWLTEVSPYQLWLYRAKDHATVFHLKSLADLKGQGLRIGVQNGSNFHEWLRTQGVGQSPDNSVVDPAPQNNLNFRKALAGRIDVFAHPNISFAYRVQQAGLSVGDFEALLPIPPLSTPLWLVASRQSDPHLVDALRAAIKSLKASGRFPLVGGHTAK